MEVLMSIAAIKNNILITGKCLVIQFRGSAWAPNQFGSSVTFLIVYHYKLESSCWELFNQRLFSALQAARKCKQSRN